MNANQSQWVLTPQKFLSPNEVTTLRSFAKQRAESHVAQGRRQGPRDWMILDIALSAGLRVSEIRQLAVGHLFIGYGQSHLLVARGKGGKSRTVILDEKLKRHLRDFLRLKKSWGESLTPEAALLVSERGEFYTRNGLQRRFKKLCQLAGLSAHHSIHSCRHTFCTELYRKTKNLRLVQKQAGHSSPGITQLYADVLGEEIKAGMDQMYESST